MSSYRKTMSEAYNDMYLAEDNVAVLRDIVKRKQMMPIKFADGSMKVDLFTASAVTQALDKVNDANREKITRLINTGKKSAFVGIAKVVMKSENDPEIEEEVDLDEAKYTRKLMKDKSVVDYVKSQQEKNRKRGNTPQDGAVYHGANWVDIAADAIGMDKMSLSKKKAFDWDSEYEAVAKKLGEEVDLDEATKWKMGDGKPRGGSNIENVRFWDLSKDELQYIMKDAGAAMKANPTAKKATSGPGNYADQVNDATTVLGWRKKNGIKEDVELDELMPATKHVAKSKKNPDMFCVFDKDGNEVKLFKDKKDAEEYAIKNHDALNEAKIDPTVAPKSAKVIGNKEDGYRLRMFFPDGHDETLPEIGRPDMNGLKSIIDKNILKHKKGIRKSWIPVVSAAMKKKPIDEKSRQLKDPKKEVMVVKKGEVIVIDKKDQDNYMKKGWKLAEGFDEASARSDAMKAMRKGKSVDPADVDNTATDDDVKAASKNILMQLRKAVNLRGTFAVEFGDKKKVKVSAKIAQAAATKYNSLKRPAEKEKFQAQIGKSYADLLKSIKESTVKESKFSIINKQLKGEK